MFNEIKLRRGQPDNRLTYDDFLAEFKKNFFDPNFDTLAVEIDKIESQAWQNYQEHRKSPRMFNSCEVKKRLNWIWARPNPCKN